MVETGERESNRQEQMIRGILQAFSADLAGQQASTESAPGAADIGAAAQRAVQEFSPAFAEKQIKLQVDPAVDLSRDWIVAGDDSRLDRVFGNLLENALRYSPPNTTVTIGLEEKGKQVLAFVDDQGPGLPKDQSPDQMFALFAKGKDKPGKAGLGLYFCKIQWNDGEVQSARKPSRKAEPASGSGCHVQQRLPATPSRKKLHAAHAAHVVTMRHPRRKRVPARDAPPSR